jgi:hypothetical protein
LDSPSRLPDVTQSKGQSSALGILSMCCINELLSKNCVPREFENYLLMMFQQTFYLLQRLTKEETHPNSTGNHLDAIDENFLEKASATVRQTMLGNNITSS